MWQKSGFFAQVRVLTWLVVSIALGCISTLLLKNKMPALQQERIEVALSLALLLALLSWWSFSQLAKFFFLTSKEKQNLGVVEERTFFILKVSFLLLFKLGVFIFAVALLAQASRLETGLGLSVFMITICCLAQLAQAQSQRDGQQE